MKPIRKDELYESPHFKQSSTIKSKSRSKSGHDRRRPFLVTRHSPHVT